MDYGTYSNMGGGNRMRKLVLWGGFAVLLAIVVIVGVLLRSGGDSPSAVSQKFASAVVKGDAKTSYSLASTAFKKSTPEKTWAESLRTIGATLDNKISPLQQTEPTKTTTLLVHTYKATAGSTQYIIRLELVQESGKWRIRYFNSSQTN